ncbi:MAG: AhpC/TSA family protein [Candidatus Azobacteroides sp.]|nr:AhpC/TSA family protein [Candidatus Azobacteroides sp.]
MKRNFIIQFVFLIPIVGIFISCSDKNRFTVKGMIKDGNEKVLYLENVTTSKAILLDSVKLSKNGLYKFKHERPTVPDFYRLRLNNQLINFAVDSTEIITINSDTLRFAQDYTVEGSSESEYIKTLTLLQLKTSETFNQLQKDYRSQTITADEYSEKANACIKEYKKEATNFIYDNPASTSAYFALFQQVNGLLLFDPYDKSDSKAYGAVANNWNQRYPEAPRTKHLVNLFTTALAIMRGEQARNFDANMVDSKDYFDVSLLSVDNKAYRLSEIGKDNVVLVDFTAYEMNESPLHNQQLAKVYEKYRAQGFRIYQISLDTDEHFWKNAAVNLPWICVIDPQSVDSDIIKKYNVRELPTGFILNRKGEFVKRVENYAELESDILSCLK